VWVRREGIQGDAKIAAMGVRVARWVTMHGLALNVCTNLDHFQLIVPCGLVGRDVTSIERELERRSTTCPPMVEVKSKLVAAFVRRVQTGGPTPPPTHSLNP